VGGAHLVLEKHGVLELLLLAGRESTVARAERRDDALNLSAHLRLDGLDLLAEAGHLLLPGLLALRELRLGVLDVALLALDVDRLLLPGLLT